MHLYGSWNGQWKNKTTGDTGDAAATVRAENHRFTITLDLFGDVFGCGDPPLGSVTLRRGQGKNKWNGRGFTVYRRKSADFGRASAVYDARTKDLSVRGNVPCQAKRKFVLNGKLRFAKLRLRGRVSGGQGGRDAVRLRLDRN